jgi:murein DD-endopeptidase MepM/ murein hydrolase activator NlpD
MTDIAGLLERARASVESAAGDPGRAGGHERYELQRVAQQFEAMLLTQMLREMRKAGEWKDGDEGAEGMQLGTESFTEAIDTELGIHLAKHQGLGLTSQLMQAFDRLAGGSGVSTPEAIHQTPAPPSAFPGMSVPQAAVPPLPTAVTSEFGWRSDPFTGQSKFHRGVDLKAAYGQEVQAAASGTVVFSGEQRGYGTTVVLEHADGSRSRYAHLSAVTVSAGSAVEGGQAVGRAGRSGRATGTHLHFEVTSPEGKPISPSQWMQGRADASEA